MERVIKKSENEKEWPDILEKAKAYLASPHGGPLRAIQSRCLDTLGGIRLVAPALEKVMVNGREVYPVTAFDIARSRGTLEQLTAVVGISAAEDEISVQTEPYRTGGAGVIAPPEAGRASSGSSGPPSKADRVGWLDRLLGRNTASEPEPKSSRTPCGVLLDELAAIPVPRQLTSKDEGARTRQQFIVSDRILDLGAGVVDELVAALRDKAWGRLTPAESERTARSYVLDSRYMVVLLLGRLKDPRAVPVLIAEANDGPPSRRQEVLRALGAIGDPSAADAVIGALRDTNADIRMVAASVLGKLGSPAAIPSLIDALKDNHEHVRGNAAESLARLGDRGAVIRLRELLTESKPESRDRILLALGQLGDDTVRVELLARASQLGTPARVMPALNGLGEYRAARGLAAGVLRFSGTLRQGSTDKWTAVKPSDPGNQLIRAWWENFGSNLATAADALSGSPDDDEQARLVREGLITMVDEYGRRDLLNRVQVRFSHEIRGEIEEILGRVREIAENLR